MNNNIKIAKELIRILDSRQRITRNVIAAA